RDTAARYDDVYCTVGVHPHEAEHEADVTLDALLSRASDAKTVGIGETGLDYYYDNAPRAAQQASFRTHIAAARASGLPLVVHTRNADADTAAILAQEMGQGAFRGVIHCFTASQAFAEQALALGFYISLSGIVTFKNAKALHAVAKAIPQDRLLVETDAPFLAPVPLRGKVCEPAYVAHTARFVAALRGVEEKALAAQTTDNFFRLFTKARRPS
ncbi:MAG: TatD family deoxyribonuclease, partial [Alphaproteobacteria bacterium]